MVQLGLHLRVVNLTPTRVGKVFDAVIGAAANLLKDGMPHTRIGNKDMLAVEAQPARTRHRELVFKRQMKAILRGQAPLFRPIWKITLQQLWNTKPNDT